MPSGSSATLSDPTAVNPTLVVDKYGNYIIQLIVNDGIIDSAIDTVEIIVIGPDTITLTPSPSQMLTRDNLTMTVTLNAPACSGGEVVDISASNTLVTAPASVTVLYGQVSASFDILSGNTSGTVDIDASWTGMTGDSSTVEVLVRDFSLWSPLVGINRTVTGTVILEYPAPSGGATIDLSVANTSMATISPSTLVIPQGSSTGSYQLTGGSSTCDTTITADGTADGYTLRALDITVTDWVIDTPSSKEIAMGVTNTFQILIAPDPAPAGGIQITLESSDPSVVEVLTPVVTVPEGSYNVMGSIRASSMATGIVTITASNPILAPDTMQVGVTSALNILETFSSFDETETDTIYIQLESGGMLFPAPAGGITVTLTSDDPDCVTVTSQITIPEGATFGTATLSYGGSATLPCTTTVTAESAIFGTDTVQVTVGQAPDLGGITVYDASSGIYRVGAGLQGQYYVYLATASHGGVTVQIESSDPSLALVAPDATTVGSPVVEVFVPNGSQYAYFYVQGVSLTTGSVNITAKNVRFTDGTASVTIVEPVLVILSLPSSTTSLSADSPFYVVCYILNTAGTAVYTYQPVSAAAGALTVTLESSDLSVGQLVTTATTGSPVTVQIPVNYYYSPTSVASGGVAFDPVGGGTTTVSATASGFDATWSGSYQTVTVTQ